MTKKIQSTRKFPVYERPDNGHDHKFLDIRVAMHVVDNTQNNVVWIMITADYYHC